jgi:hypothetical protein
VFRSAACRETLLQNRQGNETGKAAICVDSINNLRGNYSSNRWRPNFKARSVAQVLWVAASMAIVSCASVPISGKKDLLGFMEVGQTTRQDVYLHFGDPSAQYEEGSRIVTYRIGEDEGGLFVRAGQWDQGSDGAARANWTGVRYSLVLAFDETGMLRRQSLVKIRDP